ncbi:MAG: ABC transporter substrate-binding protein [Deltaproteobacteria bacterium]|nr:ABC transporter substrate-binding protein [Deltaproteobacteria bacterium]
MNNKYWSRFFESRLSLNLKSKTCPERGRRIENPKWLGLSVIAFVLVVAGAVAQAQQTAKVPRIGWLMVNYSARQEAFRQSLRELGWVEGQNITIEMRNAEFMLDRLPDFTAELVRLKVDLIVALEPPATRAAQNATKTIPIVMRSTDDPVKEGFVHSLARPGGNITGVTSVSTELYGKRLELLKEVVQKLARVAVLWDPSFRTGKATFKEMEAAAALFRLHLLSSEARRPEDFENAFRAATRGGAHALITLRNPLIVDQRKRIAELAVKSRLPAIYDDRDFVEAGGLMSYGTNLADLYRRAAYFVDRILKGAKPAELPVEQPTKFELFINLKAAKQIGLTIPPNVLARADKVIR